MSSPSVRAMLCVVGGSYSLSTFVPRAYHDKDYSTGLLTSAPVIPGLLFCTAIDWSCTVPLDQPSRQQSIVLQRTAPRVFTRVCFMCGGLPYQTPWLCCRPLLAFSCRPVCIQNRMPRPSSRVLPLRPRSTLAVRHAGLYVQCDPTAWQAPLRRPLPQLQAQLCRVRVRWLFQQVPTHLFPDPFLYHHALGPGC